MLSLSKFYLFVAAFLYVAPAMAQLNAKQTASLDQYIAERSRAPQMTPAVAGQLTAGMSQRLDALENKILPIAIILGRAMTDLKRLEGELVKTIEEVDKGQLDINPYADKGWVAITRKDMNRVCCEMKAGVGLEAHGFGAPAGSSSTTQAAPASPAPAQGFRRSDSGGSGSFDSDSGVDGTTYDTVQPQGRRGAGGGGRGAGGGGGGRGSGGGGGGGSSGGGGGGGKRGGGGGRGR